MAFRHHKTWFIGPGAHVFDGLSGLDTCLDVAILRLFDTGDPTAPDYSCSTSMFPPPFAVP
jgi:hypothetical protein